MGQPLDTILIREMVTPPVLVNSNYFTNAVRIDDREAEFSIQLVFDNGISPNLELSLQVSNDNINFSTITDSEQLIIGDVSGSVLFDISGTGATWIRVAIQVNSGSFIIQSCIKKAKRRH